MKRSEVHFSEKYTQTHGDKSIQKKDDLSVAFLY
jgi:hypothetical protein